jgi:hypothetical protein
LLSRKTVGDEAAGKLIGDFEAECRRILGKFTYVQETLPVTFYVKEAGLKIL